jgi:hydrogenase maturation protein HypF
MPENTALRIIIKGIVQGVGFRPFIYNLAQKYHLNGWVRNTSSGVEIEISGSKTHIELFLTEVNQDSPPLSRIDSVDIKDIGIIDSLDFKILTSQPNPDEFMPISPDTSICQDCYKELFDPNNPRYRYPFINCTNCGPRFTIIKDTPYDRPNTTMENFSMCDYCSSEYLDPTNRRFHAQPVACPECGPEVTLVQHGETIAEKETALEKARQILKNGGILAIKGLGGYHLACDATNEDAVRKLRLRKKRSDKPFALMAFNLELIKKHCEVNAQEQQLLQSQQRPVLLLDKKSSSNIVEEVAPNQTTLGFMLPYTPLHYLLLEPANEFPEIFIMTSGNISEEPIAYLDHEALNRLDEIADAFLIHNRPIHMRVDDSVIRLIHSKPYFLRRARGYAPDSIQLPFESHNTLAAGAELKNTFCLAREKYAFLSHHIGDLENLETLASFEEGINHYEQLFRVKPKMIACDLHPDYLSTRYAIERSQRENIPLVFVQHHHAHLASVLADNQWDSEGTVIGLCYDGTGYGTDGAIWGGEVLSGNYQKYQRRFHLKYTPLPGGDLAVRTPARMALSHLWTSNIPWDLVFPCVSSLCMEERTVIRLQLEKSLNAPLTSSMGRLFDAAAALMGGRQKVNYEGQAAIEMEAFTDKNEVGSYPIFLSNNIIDPAPLWQAMVEDLLSGISKEIMAARFHNGISDISLTICKTIRSQTGENTVALSGGVWQNKVLLLNTIHKLQEDKFQVLWHQKVPTNDGGIALGQICIATKTKTN